MVTVFPPASSHFAVAGGLGRLDLSCCARRGLAATRTSSNEPQTIAFLFMRIPPIGRRNLRIDTTWHRCSEPVISPRPTLFFPDQRSARLVGRLVHRGLIGCGPTS